MILVVNTAGEIASLAAYDKELLAEISWGTGKTLSGDLLGKLDELMKDAGAKIKNLTGIVAYSGPGSFTGLRIGISTVNAIAYTLDIPIVGVSGVIAISELFIDGRKKLDGLGNNFNGPLEPFYGAPPSVTIAKK